MINELTLVLKNILNDTTLPNPLRSALKDVVRPSDPYSPGQDTINLFLYDIRENVELRTNEPVIERSNGQAIIHQPPMRVSCCYLVTAWVPGPPSEATVVREHLLLSQALKAFGRLPIIPAGVLSGTGLATQEPLLPMVTAQADGFKNSSEFWASLGNKIRASISVMVTISLPVIDDSDAFLVKTMRTNISATPAGPTDETVVSIGGRVMRSAGIGLSGAQVDVTDAGLRAMTDLEGRFAFPRVPVGTRTIHVVAVGFVPKTQLVVVPGRPEDYEITLTPL